jgi:Holliday junction DNA helicase RuvA
MIGRLAGTVVQRAADHVLLDVRGVGYVVFVSDRTLAALPGEGEAAVLWTELVVREDLLQLFGFLTPLEKEWHRLLTTVQGVGAKSALAVLGTLGPEGVGRAIALGDARAIQAAPGIGPKIASRVVLELKSRAPAVMAMGGGMAAAAPVAAAPARRGARAAAPPPAPAPASTAEALSALTNLGYAPQEAAAAVAQAAGEAPEAATGDLIRAALRLLAPKT